MQAPFGIWAVIVVILSVLIQRKVDQMIFVAIGTTAVSLVGSILFTVSSSIAAEVSGLILMCKIYVLDFLFCIYHSQRDIQRILCLHVDDHCE